MAKNVQNEHFLHFIIFPEKDGDVIDLFYSLINYSKLTVAVVVCIEYCFTLLYVQYDFLVKDGLNWARKVFLEVL